MKNIEDLSPHALWVRAVRLRFDVAVITGEFGVLAAHFTRWLLFAPGTKFVVGVSKHTLESELRNAAHSYNMPLGDDFRAVRVISALAELRSTLSGLGFRSALHWHFAERRTDSARRAAKAAARHLGAHGGGPVTSYFVYPSSGLSIARSSRGEADVRLPVLLAPSSTRRFVNNSWPLSPTGAGRVRADAITVDKAVSHLLELALGEEPSPLTGVDSAAELSAVTSVRRIASSGLGGGPAPVEAHGLNEDDIAIFAEGRRYPFPSHSLVHTELPTPNGPLLLTHARHAPGRRRPLVVVNAAGMSAEVLERLLVAACEEYWPITWQSRYFPPWNERPLDSMGEAEVEDLGRVLDYVGTGDTLLLGWCNGAAVALEAAMRRPDGVASVALLGGVFPCHSIPNTDYHSKLGLLLPALSRSSQACAFYCSTFYGPGSSPARGNAGASGSARLNYLLSQVYRTPESLYRYANYYVRFWKEAFLASVESAERRMAALRLRGKLRFFAVENDLIGPPSNSHYCAKEFGVAEHVQLLPGNDHYLLHNDPLPLLRQLYRTQRNRHA